MPPAVGYAATVTMRCDVRAAKATSTVAGSAGGPLRRISRSAHRRLPGSRRPGGRRPPSARSCAPPTRLSARRPDHLRRRARSRPGARLGFPAFSNGAICSHGYSHIVDLHRTVRVGGLTIRPGELLHADANGVTTIPLEIAGEVARVAAEVCAAESISVSSLNAALPTPMPSAKRAES